MTRACDSKVPSFYKLVNRLFAKILLAVLLRLKYFSERFIVLFIKGRRSGKEYLTPLCYLRRGNEIGLVSVYGYSSSWMRNFVKKSKIRAVYRGKSFTCSEFYILEYPANSSVVREYLKRYRLGLAFISILSPDVRKVKWIKETPVVVVKLPRGSIS